MTGRGRTCVGCRCVFPRADLVRLARAVGGGVGIDRIGHAEGRGAYLCRRMECFEQGWRRIGGALRGGAVDAEALRREFEQLIGSER